MSHLEQEEKKKKKTEGALSCQTPAKITMTVRYFHREGHLHKLDYQHEMPAEYFSGKSHTSKYFV